MASRQVPAAVGIDLISWKRIKMLLEHPSASAAGRVLTSSESAKFKQAPDPVRFFARCFAAKEAALKARGDVLAGPDSFSGIEISFGEGDRFEARFGETLQAGEFFETPDGLGARMIFWERA